MKNNNKGQSDSSQVVYHDLFQRLVLAEVTSSSRPSQNPNLSEIPSFSFGLVPLIALPAYVIFREELRLRSSFNFMCIHEESIRLYL